MNFISQFWLPLAITSMGGVLYASVILWISKASCWQAAALFLTGIIVITCIFLPFNWSIQHSGSEKEVSLFFFDLNIE